ncbi:hypothetical protein V6N13_001461 [Hibiscus sabdariffa]|uniref:RNase H type-1 domain-containing protein n=1 Tax=Hibiscus sabdariffa TaxID=183260 RepID=A0ABR2G9F3_9ROSI
MFHAFRDCPASVEALRCAGIPYTLISLHTDSFLHWIEHCARCLPTNTFNLLLTVMWNLWNRRNDWYISYYLFPSRTHALDATPEGYIKINTDGALDRVSRSVGLGVVARDSHGIVLGGLSQQSPSSSDVLHVEFLAVHAGVLMARDKGWRNVILETDSITIVNKFNRLGPDLSTLSPLIDDVRLLLAEFADCRVIYVPRTCNLVSHTLATNACHSRCSLFFDSVCPNIIRNVVTIDIPS